MELRTDLNEQSPAALQAVGFMALLKERRRLWGSQHAISDPRLREEFKLLMHINNKMRGARWVSDLGYPTIPSRLYPGIAVALKDTRLDRFVLKPAAGHSSHGVYLLKRDGLGGYVCDMTGQSYASDDALIAHFAAAQNVPNRKITEAVIIEEYINDSQNFAIPLDYKVYAFPTGTPLIMQRYGPAHLPKSEWGFEFYTEAGERLPGVRKDLSSGHRRNMPLPQKLNQIVETAKAIITRSPAGVAKDLPSGNRWNMQLPHNFDQIVETAKGIIARTPVSFVRIDLYSTADAIVFGEFTPVPNNGKGDYTEPYNSILGDHWTRSLDLMGLDYTSDTKSPI